MKVISESTLDLFRGPGTCEWCRKSVSRREPHHIFARGMGGGKRLDAPLNLIALCATFSGGDDCHHAVTVGDLARYDMLAAVAVRMGVMQHHIEEAVYRLRRAPREGRLCKGCGGLGCKDCGHRGWNHAYLGVTT